MAQKVLDWGNGNGLYIGPLSCYQYQYQMFDYAIDLSSFDNPYISKIKYHLQFDVLDIPSQNLINLFDKCNKFIELARRNNKNILVNCYAGISRSSTIILAYLMYTQRINNQIPNLQTCFNYVRKIRPIIQPNIGFWEQLLFYQRSLN